MLVVVVTLTGGSGKSHDLLWKSSFRLGEQQQTLPVTIPVQP